ncbi:MAG: PfkB family carbohydrate kinase [Chloroflexota bacterium]|nr:PfkB family carbohydrate kinase [Chloroflexota bacterium]
MNAPDYLLLGNITADLVPEGRALGGTVSYSAPTAAAFGLQVGLVTRAAAREPLLLQLADSTTICAHEAPETTTFENLYTPHGRVQYVRGIAGAVAYSDIPEAWRTAPLVHLAPIAGEVDPALARFFPHARVMLTLQGCLRQWGTDGRVHFRRWLDADVLRTIDVVVFSEEDIAESPEMEQEIVQVASHVVVTRAERGGTLYSGGAAVDYPTPVVQLVHPTGAGDIFAAALLCALHTLGNDYERACQVAARVAANSVTRVGLSSVPTLSEVAAALQS